VGQSRDAEGNQRNWLQEIDTQISPGSPAKNTPSPLCGVREGDFVRIENAHLLLPPYAAILPKVRYALRNLTGLPKKTKPPGPGAASELKAYRQRLGPNPRLPFIVVPAVGSPGGRPVGVSFFVPVRYRWIIDEPSLLLGNLTIVGKIAFRDLRGLTVCGRSSTTRPVNYSDRQTTLTYTPALQAAPNSLLESLNLRRGDVRKVVQSSVTLSAPMMVVVPTAIYQ
jgi:hypothetical protein